MEQVSLFVIMTNISNHDLVDGPHFRSFFNFCWHFFLLRYFWVTQCMISPYDSPYSHSSRIKLEVVRKGLFQHYYSTYPKYYLRISVTKDTNIYPRLADGKNRKKVIFFEKLKKISVSGKNYEELKY